MAETVVPGEDQAISRRIEETAQREGLGAVRSVYPVGRKPESSTWAWVVTGGLVLAAVITGVTGAHSGRTHWAGFFGMVAFLWFLITLGIYLRGRNYSRKLAGGRLEVREHGLVIGYRDRAVGVRYDTVRVYQNLVRHMRNGVDNGTTYTYTFFLSGKRIPVIIDHSFTGVQQWGPEIQQAVVNAQAPLALARLRAGEKVEFGTLWITATEVGTLVDSAPWGQVTGLTIADGAVKLHSVDGPLNLRGKPIKDIPNFFVFRALFEHLRQAHNPAAAG
ncbi:hypothetical protein GPX89_03650 [Nocardia sp. ET3-3]|uniref:Uncharacterized protein n=1 Tax=Nocardia terrae TaxID=2675851 RepID=A0A7K1UPR0_9NOCA|nr:DUF6585 family protein [Nocardia terrae]MVU76336.1 hypothetical protein [Nocardia terrae]